MEKEFEAFYILKDTASGLQAYTPSEISNACNVVKQALTDKQDLEKFTMLVVEKKVELMSLFLSSSAEQYNNQFVRDENKLTEEEFNFLKEMIAKYGKSI